MIRFLIYLLLAIIPSVALAANGDILATDLHDTASIGSTGKRSVVSYGGAPGGSGVCVVANATNGLAQALYWNVNFEPSSEITIVYWERFSEWPLEWTAGGCKSSRVFIDTTNGVYVSSMLTFHGGNALYVDRCINATVSINPDVVTDVRLNYGYADLIGTNLYKQQDWYWEHTWEGMGTGWRKIRMWIKMPSAFGASDGESKLWIDEELHYHAYDWSANTSGTTKNTIESVRFLPDDESGTPNEHWYDEITIYEGYVPPDGTPLPEPEDPTPTITGPIPSFGGRMLSTGGKILVFQ